MMKQRSRLMAIFIFLASFVLAGVLSADEEVFDAHRRAMVEQQIAKRGVNDDRVLRAMKKVKRHLFVPADLIDLAYDDAPLPIGYGQTISQPYIVAYMTEAARLRPTDRVLEIGTGSGYQAAVLAEIVEEVYTIEIIEALARESDERLKELGYKNIEVRYGDGYKGWPEKAPFDAIIVTAAAPEIPAELVRELKVGGRMVIPLGSFFQDLYLITRTPSGIDKTLLLPVRFVPMVRSNR